MYKAAAGQAGFYRCSIPALAGRLYYRHFKGKFMAIPPVGTPFTMVFWDFPATLPVMLTVQEYYQKDLHMELPWHVKRQIKKLTETD